MEEYVKLAFDKLGYPSSQENPEDIEHITLYISAPDTQAALDIINAYPILFQDPVVLQVISLVRQFQIAPPPELARHSSQPPTTPALSTSAPQTQTPENPALPRKTIIGILSAIADGSLTSLSYDFKAHMPVTIQPSISDRLQAIKILEEMSSANKDANLSINILAPVQQPPSSQQPSSTQEDN